MLILSNFIHLLESSKGKDEPQKRKADAESITCTKKKSKLSSHYNDDRRGMYILDQITISSKLY